MTFKHGAFIVLRLLFRIARFFSHGTRLHRIDALNRLYELFAKWVASRHQESSSDSPMLVTYKGTFLWVPSTDIALTPGLILATYETREINCFIQRLGPLTTFVDVGANCGLWTCVVGKSSCVEQIVAFEPNPKLCELLKRNVTGNQLSSVEIVPCAVGDDVREVYLRVEESLATGYVSLQPGLTSLPVLQTTLDSYFGELAVSNLAIKIDCEGKEPSVLKGARNLISSHRPLLMIELNFDSDVSALNDWRDVIPLLSANYSDGYEFTARRMQRIINVDRALNKIVDDKHYKNVVLIP